ncbi:hypothetical protein [Chitinophaga sp. S165]|uniref:hypothetical protein n=1 Tax=Chitinophaga sp. S165 TaxID=2135462 RepID=UPI000D71C80E|nr:hypothetical protein [Chitinophaga sp. S165]PWV53522.1 hypothetical protein C7475_102272 [Chitinophaga sp. S165]
METMILPLLDILNELYIGTENDESWVIDAKPGHGFTRAIKTMSAKDASTPIVDGGSTIAAHTYHLKWSLDFAMEFYKGNQPTGNWPESWRIKEVNEAEWADLQQELLNSYHNIRDAVTAVKDWSNPYLLKGTISLLPHAAYHLGAVKQLMLAVNKGSQQPDVIDIFA